MPALFQKYKEWPHGVVNAIEPSEIPFDAVHKSQNFYFRENFWRKLPGLVEMNTTIIDTEPVWGVSHFHQIAPSKAYYLAACGGSLYKFDPQNKTFSAVHSSMVDNKQVEFLEYSNQGYFGSQYDAWRRFDGGNKTYPVGNGSTAIKAFKKVIFNPYSGRFFGIGELTNPDYLYYSEHIDNEGIEKWPAGNIQIIESIEGDTPQEAQLFEGRINIFNQNSIHSGSVIGVPETWTFQREKSQTGTIAGRTVKRQGNSFFMLSPQLEIYQWPQDRFVSLGRVKLEIDPNNAHLACAEIVDNRYYYLAFKHNKATSTNKYHVWVYDILGDRFYGPHIQYNIVSMFYDRENRQLLCGGVDDLQGFVLEHRGRDIKNVPSKGHWVSSFSDYGEPTIDKRYTKFHIKSKQEGSDVGGEGQLEVIVNVDNRYDLPQSQRIALHDPANEDNTSTAPLYETGAVKEAITKRGHIHERFGRGNAVQVEIKHEIQNGDFSFSTFELEYYLRYRKKNRGEG